jgi:hypothetical protein
MTGQVVSHVPQVGGTLEVRATPLHVQRRCTRGEVLGARLLFGVVVDRLPRGRSHLKQEVRKDQMLEASL